MKTTEKANAIRNSVNVRSQFPAASGNERGVAGGHIEFLCRLNQCLAAICQTISGSHGRLQGHLSLPVQTIDLGHAPPPREASGHLHSKDDFLFGCRRSGDHN